MSEQIVFNALGHCGMGGAKSGVCSRVRLKRTPRKGNNLAPAGGKGSKGFGFANFWLIFLQNSQKSD
jgi:hypothetical protein